MTAGTLLELGTVAAVPDGAPSSSSEKKDAIHSSIMALAKENFSVRRKDLLAAWMSAFSCCMCSGLLVFLLFCIRVTVSTNRNRAGTCRLSGIFRSSIPRSSSDTMPPVTVSRTLLTAAAIFPLKAHLRIWVLSSVFEQKSHIGSGSLPTLQSLSLHRCSPSVHLKIHDF